MEAIFKSALCLVVLYLANGAASQSSRNLTLEAFRTRSSTYQVSRADPAKPPIPPNKNKRYPYVINLLTAPKIHGFLGDAPVPGYNNITSENASDTNIWRVVCKRMSEVFVIVMNVEIEGKGGAKKAAEYLHIRRKIVRGTSNRYYAYNLKKNSILVAHVNSANMPSTYYPFRIAYFCIPQVVQNDGADLVMIASELLQNYCILKYIAEHPDALDDLDWLFQSSRFTIDFENIPDDRAHLHEISRIQVMTRLRWIQPELKRCVSLFG